MPRIKYTAPNETDTNGLVDQYYTPRELADILGISVSALAEYRRQGTGPKFKALGYHTYRYAKEDVLKFIEEKTRTSTSANRNYDL